MRFSLMTYQMPEIKGPQFGCFAKIPHHPPLVTKGFLKSTYQDDYLSRFKNFKSSSGSMAEITGTSSGMISSFEPVDQKHISSKLVNERYNNGPERKYNTEIQRTWIYQKDPGIYAVENLKIDNRARKPWTQDIKFMSLPMFNDEECQKMRYKNNVSCGYKLSDITKRKLKEMAEQRKKREQMEAAMNAAA